MTSQSTPTGDVWVEPQFDWHWEFPFHTFVPHETRPGDVESAFGDPFCHRCGNREPHPAHASVPDEYEVVSEVWAADWEYEWGEPEGEPAPSPELRERLRAILAPIGIAEARYDALVDFIEGLVQQEREADENRIYRERTAAVVEFINHWNSASDRRLVREHLDAHLTDGRWHDRCGFCLNRRRHGSNGVERWEAQRDH